MISSLISTKSEFERCVLTYAKGDRDTNKQKVLSLQRNTSTRLIIKNMICSRCKMFVRSVLKKLNLHYTLVELGEVVIMEKLTSDKRKQLKSALLEGGLQLMDDKKAVLVDKVKNLIVEKIDYADELPDINYSIYLSEKLSLDYTQLSNTFSTVTGISIQKFVINYKIEKVKELLSYGELSLSEISYKLQFSSTAHLSNQFKKVTGFTPSFYKEKSTRNELS